MKIKLKYVGVALVAAALLSGCASKPGVDENDASSTETATSEAGSTTSKATMVQPSKDACNFLVSGEPARPVDPPENGSVPSSGTQQFTMHMNAGDVTLTLDRSQAPCAVRSFENLVSQGYFDNTKCHRLVDSGIFILQCGDPTGTGRGGPGYTFADELPEGGEQSYIIYPRGAVAMANAGPDTNGSQFFIVWDDSPLAPAYTIMGTVDDESLAVIGAIASQGVDAADGITPIEDATIKSIVAG